MIISAALVLGGEIKISKLKRGKIADTDCK
jgi:hypothetical protein